MVGSQVHLSHDAGRLGDLLCAQVATRTERLAAAEARGARIPRLEARQREVRAEAQRRSAALRTMIDDTRTKSFDAKLDDASRALYAFHTLREPPPPRGGETPP
mmetsp:Transcript_17288/g.69515  ORF Transcript_17288/g.69515 Transcript_17288/m.69515 type:complete len:104 (-) Transcript_17288:1374-1685(-)